MILVKNEPGWRWSKIDNATTQKLRWTEVDKRHKETRTNTYIDTNIERQKKINVKLNQDELRWIKRPVEWAWLVRMGKTGPVSSLSFEQLYSLIHWNEGFNNSATFITDDLFNALLQPDCRQNFFTVIVFLEEILEHLTRIGCCLNVFNSGQILTLALN